MNFKNGQMIPLKDLTNRVKVGFVGSCNNDYCNSDEGYPMIRTTNLTNSGINLSNLKYVTKEFYEKYEKSQLHYGDILIARHGNNGLASLWTENFKAQCLNVVIVETNDEIADKYFLYYMINSIHVQKQLKAMVGGSVQGVVNTKDIADVLIPYYDLDTQRRLVDTLRKIDQKIELNTKINNNLFNLGKLIFKRWFVDFEFPNKNNKPYKSNKGEFKESVLGKIPSQWNIDNLGNYLKVSRGLSYKGKYLDEGIPLINLGNILPNGEFRDEKLKYYSGDYQEKHVIKEGDLVVANTDLTQDRLVIGSPIIIPNLNAEHMIFSHHLYKLSDLKLPKQFIYNNLMDSRYNYMVGSVATGTTVLALPKTDLEKYPIIIPEKEILFKYEKIMENIQKEKEKIYYENKKLMRLRDTLLPKLMSGEIDVSGINFDLE